MGRAAGGALTWAGTVISSVIIGVEVEEGTHENPRRGVLLCVLGRRRAGTGLD